MDFELLDAKLEKAFARSRRVPQIGGGTLASRKVPAPLWKYVEQVMDADERDEFGGDFEYWPGSVCELLGDFLVDVLSVDWDGFGPTSFSAGIQVFDFDDHAWLAWWDETGSYRTVARVERWRDYPNLANAVMTLVRDNGTSFGIELFGSLPTDTENRLPELLPTTIVRDAYFDWMGWAEREIGGAWDGLAEEHYGRIVEPDHLQRCLDLLQRLPRLDDPEAVSAYLEPDDGPELDERARQRLFDEWFAITYTVTASPIAL